MTRCVTSSSRETRDLGRSLAQSLVGGDVVALFGDLGSGKTEFVMGVCEQLGARGHVASPTFTLINEYPAENCMVAHMDLYRISSAMELAELGVSEYWAPPFISLIEWADRIEDHLPESCIRVRLEFGPEHSSRVITIGEE